jgi:RNA methyltransferase, TrmH family
MNQNQIKKITSLEQSKYRRKYGLFLVEGLHLMQELIKSKWEIETILVTFEAAVSPELANILKVCDSFNIPIERINQKVFEKLSSTESPQGIMAIAKIPGFDIRQILLKDKILIADGIADPGNLGTMIRTAAAFGFKGVITTPGSADFFSSKTVRATQGALFQVIPLNHLTAQEIISKVKPTHKIYSLSGHATGDLHSIKLTPQLALVVGAEIAGVSEALLTGADYTIKIPISNRIESLNAAIAASIAMYEIARRNQ